MQSEMNALAHLFEVEVEISSPPKKRKTSRKTQPTPSALRRRSVKTLLLEC